jgi:hypothetical protein
MMVWRPVMIMTWAGMPGRRVTACAVGSLSSISMRARRAIRRAMSEQAAPEAKHWLNINPLPVLINRYYRNYFVSSDGRMRATIDTRQKVWDQRYDSRPSFKLKANLPETLVVEFKFDRNLAQEANRMLQGFPLRVSRHSKYVNGALAIQAY